MVRTTVYLTVCFPFSYFGQHMVRTVCFPFSYFGQHMVRTNGACDSFRYSRTVVNRAFTDVLETHASTKDCNYSLQSSLILPDVYNHRYASQFDALREDPDVTAAFFELVWKALRAAPRSAFLNPALAGTVLRVATAGLTLPEHVSIKAAVKVHTHTRTHTHTHTHTHIMRIAIVTAHVCRLSLLC
jgi:hypothetical protein